MASREQLRGTVEGHQDTFEIMEIEVSLSLDGF